MNSAWLANVLVPVDPVRADTPLLDGISRARTAASRVLVVMDQAARPVGMFGVREALAILAGRAELRNLVVADAMSAPCPHAAVGLHPAEAWRRMCTTKSHCLLLLDPAGAVDGLVTEQKLVRHPVFRARARAGRVAIAMRADRLSAGATLADALAQMAGLHIDCLLVEQGGEVVGMLGEGDILAAVDASDAWSKRPIREVMREIGPGIAVDASLAEALEAMASRGDCLPVVDSEGHKVGVVTLRDIAGVVCAQDPPDLAASKRRRAIQSSGGKSRAWLLAMVAVLAVFLTEQLIEYFASERALEQERNRVLGQLSTLRARLEGGVNANLFLARGLAAVIAAQPHLDQAGFSAIARGLVSKEFSLRSVAGAPDMVVSLLYPMVGNESVIGLDYRTHPSQRDAALSARDSGRTVIAGPLKLVQGGVGIIVREPVFLPVAEAGSVPRFWGLVSAVIDADRLYAQAGMDDPSSGLRLALRGTDGSGEQGPAFFGDEAIFGLRPVTQEVRLPAGSWQLAAVPAAGWGRIRSGEADLIRLMGLVAAIASGLLAFGLVRRTQAVASHGARVEALLNTVPEMIWMKDPGGAFVACNPRFEQFFAVREAEIVGLRAGDFLSGRQAEAGISVSRSVEEWCSFDGQGNEAVFEAINTPVADAAGNLIGILGVARDITERKRSEIELRRQHDILERTSRLARVGGWELEVASMQLSWTDEAARIHDLVSSGVIPVSEGLSFYHGDSRRLAERAFNDAIERGEAFDIELELTSALGIVRYVRTIGFPVRQDGKVVRLEGALQDISMRRAAEARAQQGELVLDSVFEALPDMFLLLEMDGTVRDYRARRSDFFVYSESILGKKFSEYLPADVALRIEGAVAKLLGGDGPVVLEYELPMPGGVRHYEARLSRLPDASRCIAVVRDISERVQSLAELEAQRRESAFLADLMERSSQPVAVGMPGGSMGRCNQAFLDLLGYTREEIARLDWARDLTPEHWLPAELGALERLKATRRPVRYEKEYIRKDGNLVPIEIHVDIVNTPDGTGDAYFAFITDISERKRADAALRESEARYKQLFENNPAPMLVYERGSLQLLAVNSAFVAHYGYSRSEALKLLLTDLYPESEKLRIVEMAAKLSGLAYVGEWKHLRKDGSRIVIEARSHDIEFQGRSGRVAVINDITERKRLEEEIRALNVDLESRVQARTEELAAANKELETFTYSVSHDLKAPLRGIDGYSRLLLEDHYERLDEEGRQFLENVHRGVLQMNQLIEDLLAYSRMERRTLQGEALVLSEQVERVLDERRADIAARGMRVEVALDGLVAVGDRDGLAMVIRNLVDNAVKFTKTCESPRLRITGRAEQDRVVVEFADNGIGFDMRFHDRIFDIFQRLQRAEDYPGTGVGLAIVRKAMLRMGGSIKAQSAPAEGATFYLEFPR